MTPDRDIARLLEIMQRLRDPQQGCPWDTKQDFRSIAPYTLEEAYEVVDAIEQGDMAELRDELGDLLFQVVFHAQMARERDAFGFEDVVFAICDKMIRRHPHVFADTTHDDEQALHAAWDAQKQQERAAKRQAPGHASLMDGVAKTLPALVRAEKLQRRAARAGFDWDSAAPVMDKIQEELAECAQAMAEADAASRVNEEVGDLLFSCVNLARHLGVDAEQALRDANAKFDRRFRFVEQGLASQGLSAGPEVNARMEGLWERAKQEERGKE